MEISNLDVNRLSGMSRVEQAWMIETAERKLDELERRLSDDSESLRTIESMRRQIVEVQRQLYGC